MVALGVAHAQRLHGGEHLAAALRHLVGRVIADACPRFCASSSIAKVESPRMLMRAIGSIWTATSGSSDFRFQGTGTREAAI